MTARKAIFLAIAIAALAAPAARAQEVTNAQEATNWYSMATYLNGMGLSQETLEDIKTLIENRTPPIVKNVTFKPEQPQADEPVTVTATAVVPPYMDGGDIAYVYINYTTDDGKTVETIPMERDDNNESLWRGEIPGQSSGTKVAFGLQAANVYDENYVELFCMADKDVVEHDRNIPDCETPGSPENCDALKPSGCMVPLSLSSDEFKQYDTKNEGILPDLDIFASRIGERPEGVLLDLGVKGKVTPGQFSPMDMHLYVGGWINPDKGGSETGINAILNQGAVVLYTPLNPGTKCGIYYFRGNSLESDAGGVNCNPLDSYMHFTIDRRWFADNPSRKAEFLFLTFTLWGLSPPVVKLDDASLFTRVSFEKREYTVQ